MAGTCSLKRATSDDGSNPPIPRLDKSLRAKLQWCMLGTIRGGPGTVARTRAIALAFQHLLHRGTRRCATSLQLEGGNPPRPCPRRGATGKGCPRSSSRMCAVPGVGGLECRCCVHCIVTRTTVQPDHLAHLLKDQIRPSRLTDILARDEGAIIGPGGSCTTAQKHRAEILETILYGCIMWSSHACHNDTLRRALHSFLTRCIEC